MDGALGTGIATAGGGHYSGGTSLLGLIVVVLLVLWVLGAVRF
jgi:hypothetical protein